MANPYQASNVEVLSDLAQTGTKRGIQEAFSKTAIQKGKLQKQFTQEQQDALEKFRKKSKGGIFGKLSKLSPLAGMFSPLLSAIMGGIGTAGVGLETRKAAKALPGMEGWKTTFLSDPARAQESVYKGIRKKAPSIFDSLLSGVTSGVSSKVMGDAFDKALRPASTEGIKIFGKGAKDHGKFFERLRKKLGKTAGEIDPTTKKVIPKSFFDRMQGSIKGNELLDKNWLKLLQTAPELKGGNLTDFMNMMNPGQAKYGSKEELDEALNSKQISQEEYDIYIQNLF